MKDPGVMERVRRSRLRRALEAKGLAVPPELARRKRGRPRTRQDKTVAVRPRRRPFHRQDSRPKPTHTKGGLPFYDERRLLRLLRATDHVAPRLHVQRLWQSNRLRDATAVVKMYVSGTCVKVLGGDLLRRLATDGYGKGLRPRGRAA